jgi:Ni,Fe-hydrogenase I large subunit
MAASKTPNRIVVDPVTRIEGHLKIEVELENGKVKDAWSSGTMARGFEALLLGKDPRDSGYVTSRFCGVCYSVHQYASVMAQDMAFGAKVPNGGRLLRNLMMGAEYMYDHVIHFYQLTALDYLDLTAVLAYKGKDAALLGIKDKIAALVAAGDPHPLLPHYKYDGFCVKDPEIVLSAVKHYLEALKHQVLVKDASAILGGRAPHFQALVVGGATQYPNVESLRRFRSMINESMSFIKNVYLADVLALGTGPLLPLGTMDVGGGKGLGGGHNNYMAYGAFPNANGALALKGGVIRGLENLNNVQPVDFNKITESVKSSWYKDAPPVHPYKGEQVFDLARQGAYSFVKSPRYDGLSMEVGPLAQGLVHKFPVLMSLVGKGVKPGALARIAARCEQTVVVADAMNGWLDELEADMGKSGFAIQDTAHWDPPAEGQGYGAYDAPRGALVHFLVVKDKKIANYQAVVPSTWNASPRDEKGVRGQYEEALIGCPIPDPENPINIVRIIRSFDPCLACAIHIIHPRTNEVLKFVVE